MIVEKGILNKNTPSPHRRKKHTLHDYHDNKNSVPGTKASGMWKQGIRKRRSSASLLDEDGVMGENDDDEDDID